MAGEERASSAEGYTSKWEAIQSKLSEYHWALQDYLRNLVVRSSPHDGQISPCPRCKGNGKGPPGDGGLAQRKQAAIQAALQSREAQRRAAAGLSRPGEQPTTEQRQRGRWGRGSRQPFAMLRRLWGGSGAKEQGGREPRERQCWFCDGVGIMPVVNLHGFLCAWAPAAFDSREHPYFPPRPPPPSALRLQRMLQPRPSVRRGQRRGVRAEGAGREFRGSFKLMRVGKARKVTGERLQQFVGSLVPDFEARERAEQMPHWHEGRSRRRGNLLDFDWRRAQWIADVQDIAETGEGQVRTGEQPFAPAMSVGPGAGAAAGPPGVWAKAAHLTWGEGQAGRMQAAQRWLARWRSGGGEHGPGAEAPPAAEGGWHMRRQGRAGNYGGPATPRRTAPRTATAGGRGDGQVPPQPRAPGLPQAGGQEPALVHQPSPGADRPGGARSPLLTLDAEFPEDVVSIRPGYEEGEEAGAVGQALQREVTFRDRIFHPRLHSSPLLQPMLRISEALSLSFLKEHKAHQQAAQETFDR